MKRLITATVLVPLSALTLYASTATAAVYCTGPGYPVGCVVRPPVVVTPAPVVVVPAPVVVAPAPAVVVAPGVGARGVGVAPGVGAPGVGAAPGVGVGAPGAGVNRSERGEANRGGPVNRAGAR